MACDSHHDDNEIVYLSRLVLHLCTDSHLDCPAFLYAQGSVFNHHGKLTLANLELLCTAYD